MTTTLLVDGTQNFVRNYVIFPSTNSNGEHYGGVIGFLRSLKSFIDITKADRVIVVFDAAGGSKRRKALYGEYKSNRKPLKLNRAIEMGEDEEKKSKVMQSLRLREYLQDLPVSVIEIPDIEADDTIAYLTQYFRDDRKIIASNDKDFYQLLDNQTVLYKPTKKTFYTQNDCHNEFGIRPINFALARAITGDSSDNIHGIKGIGLKTLLKLCPQFREKDEITVDNFMEWCQQQEDARHSVFIANKQLVIDNYKIMRLTEPIISAYSISAIKSSIKEYSKMNSTNFLVKLVRDGIDIGNSFMQTFLTLSLAGKKYTHV